MKITDRAHLICIKSKCRPLSKSYIRTYKLDAVISNCCNNYGPYQFPEKLIPKMISNILNNKNYQYMLKEGIPGVDSC